MNHRFFTIAGVAIVLAVLLGGCGPSMEEKRRTEMEMKQLAAVSKALADFQTFRAATTGFQAEQLRNQMRNGLVSVGLSLQNINVTESELLVRENQLYNSDAETVAQQLRNTHGNSQRARELVNEVRRLKTKANQPVSAELEQGMELSISRNLKEEARAIDKAHGVRPQTHVMKRPARHLSGRHIARRR